MLMAGLDGWRSQAWIIREMPTPTTEVVRVGILLFGWGERFVVKLLG